MALNVADPSRHGFSFLQVFSHILQQGLIDRFAVEDGSVGRVEILQTITHHTGCGVGLGDNPSVQARGARVIDTYICVKCAAQSYF